MASTHRASLGATAAILIALACVPSRVTPLAAAARSGDVAAIDRLVGGGADVNEPSGANAWPPAVHAIHTRQPQALRRLLDHGATLDGRTGRDALFMAAGYGDAETVALLLSRGVPLPQDAPSLASLMATAIGGSWDIDDQWSGCDRHTAVARLIVAKDPDSKVVGVLSPTSFARARSTLEYRLATMYARHKGCTDLLQVVSP